LTLISRENHTRYQDDFCLEGLLVLRDFARAGLRTATGLTRTDLSARTAAVSPRVGLKYTRHPGESSDFLLTMQVVTRSTSGISEPQSRNASPLQAACSSW